MHIIHERQRRRDDRARTEPTQLCPCFVGRRAARPLAELSPPRATVSLWGPKGARPEANPWLTLPKCTRAKIELLNKTIQNYQSRSTNDQKRRPPKTIFVVGAQEQCVHEPIGTGCMELRFTSREACVISGRFTQFTGSRFTMPCFTGLCASARQALEKTSVAMKANTAPKLA